MPGLPTYLWRIARISPFVPPVENRPLRACVELLLPIGQPVPGTHIAIGPNVRNETPAAKDLAVFLGRSPDTASFEDVRRFQLHLVQSGVQPPILNHAVSALRFFFRVTLKRHDIVEHTTFIHAPRKLPVVLSPAEVARPLNAASGLRYKAALSVAYGAGLRAAAATFFRPRQPSLKSPQTKPTQLISVDQQSRIRPKLISSFLAAASNSLPPSPPASAIPSLAIPDPHSAALSSRS
jgi:hypothetical protein